MSRGRSFHDALRSARARTGRTVRDLATGAGVSRRSFTRWEGGHAMPRAEQVHRILRVLHAIDPALVPDVANAAGVAHEKLGFGPRPVAPRVLRLEAKQIADSIVCAAADAVGATPAEARLALKGAFARMKEIGATIDDVAPWLEAPSS